MDEDIQALLVAAGLLYLVPTVIASMRRHPNAGAIMLLNVLLGWTLLGWVVALVWSVTAFSRPAAAGADKTCPKCAENVKAAALVCRFCGHEFAQPDPGRARKVWFHWNLP